MSIKKSIENVFTNYINWTKENKSPNSISTVVNIKNNLNISTVEDKKMKVNDANISLLLSNEVEFSSGRKQRGVYYTPTDVVAYTVYNLFLNTLTQKSDVRPIDKIKQESYDPSKILELCTKKIFLDPTCGAGEFILSVLQAKLYFLKSINQDSPKNIISAISTIRGNDIDENATLVSKLRILIYLYQENIIALDDKIFNIINSNFSNYDFIFDSIPKDCKYDFIIGNPPYIEYRSLNNKPKTGYGNSYADVLHNTNRHLYVGGGVAYIIPISFSSTPRMKEIRNEEINSFSKLIALHFADRPDSLFKSVHQKVEIVFGIGFQSKKPKLYTSKYNYWYKGERSELFNDLSIVENNDYDSVAIPKYGNEMQKDIYRKVTNFYNRQLSDYMARDNKGDYDGIYLSKRASFYIKAFFKDPKSNEYDHYRVNQISSKALLAILSSSLFWMYWVIISDGWHLTNKELEKFTIPLLDEKTDLELSKLADNLLDRLERTKVYVGTAQTDYEYKHKLALDIIDEIDETLGTVYNLTNSELDYVKNYERKYRGG